MSIDRDALGDAHDQRDARRRTPRGSRRPRRAAARRCTLAFAPVAFTACVTVSKTGTLPSNFSPPRPGVTPATTCVPYSSICFAWKPPALPVMPCTRRLRVLADEDAHRSHLLASRPRRSSARRRPWWWPPGSRGRSRSGSSARARRSCPRGARRAAPSARAPSPRRRRRSR